MSFTFEPLRIRDVVAVRPHRHLDDRGFFQEIYRESSFQENGIDAVFVQDNVSRSHRGVLRGLHYQIPPEAQGKLIGVVRGSIFDVALDLRAGGPTYGKWVGRTLSVETGEFLWIPPGFAHGYVVLSDTADVAYKVTAEYRQELSRGIQWNDPALGIQWPVESPILSDADRDQPPFSRAEKPFHMRDSR